MNIGFVGLGYVGLVSAVAMADFGHNVIGFDQDEENEMKDENKSKFDNNYDNKYVNKKNARIINNNDDNMNNNKIDNNKYNIF